MAKNENSEQLQEEKPLEEMFTELDLLGNWRIARHHWRILSDCTDRVWNF